MDSQPGPSRIKDPLDVEQPKKKLKIEEDDDDVGSHGSSTTIHDLPDEMLINIFKYLTVQERLKAEKVCCKWQLLVRSDVLWRYVKASGICESSFIEIVVSLPPCVLHLECDPKKGLLLLPISLQQLMAKLHERCPSLKTLLLNNMILANNVKADDFAEMCLRTAESLVEKRVNQIIESKFVKDENIRMLDTSLPEVKILSIRRISFGRFLFSSHIVNCVLPKITVLDLSHSQPLLRDVITTEPFSTLVDLEELYLGGWRITDENILVFLKYLKKLKILDLNYCLVNRSAIATLLRYGIWLEELYLCRTNIKHILRSSGEKEIFPRLQFLCLRQTDVTKENITDLLTACPSLKVINVSDCEDIGESWYHSLSNDFKEKLYYTEKPKDCYTTAYICDHFLERKYYSR